LISRAFGVTKEMRDDNVRECTNTRKRKHKQLQFVALALSGLPKIEVKTAITKSKLLFFFLLFLSQTGDVG